MIEDLKLQAWYSAPAGLDGKDKEPLVKRLVCSYFPPHVAIAKGFMEEADPKYLTILATTGYPETTEQLPVVDEVLQIQVDNGGAVYLLGTPDESGTREGILWKLIPGLESVERN